LRVEGRENGIVSTPEPVVLAAIERSEPFWNSLVRRVLAGRRMPGMDP
jgi:hypothetical protein